MSSSLSSEMFSKATLSAVYEGGRSWLEENSVLAIGFTSIVTVCASAVIYHEYKKIAGSDKEEYINWDYPSARRKIMYSAEIENPNNFELKEEYVQVPDGNLIYTRTYIPKNVSNIKGMICHNLGYKSYIHCQAHEEALEWAERGYIVFAHDTFGHGRSDGLYLYCPHFERYVKHASYVHNLAKLKYSKLYNIPKNGYFLLGSSMGGAVCIHESVYGSQSLNNDTSNNNNNNNIPDWSGMLLVCPMVRVDPNLVPPDWVINIFRYLLVPLFPKLEIAPVSNPDNYLLSPEAPKRIVEQFNDPIANPLKSPKNLKPRLITARSLGDATDWIQENIKKVKLPFIVLHNEKDRVTNSQSSKWFYENAASTKKDIKLYEGKECHAIFMDGHGPEAMNDCHQWMQQMTKNG